MTVPTPSSAPSIEIANVHKAYRRGSTSTPVLTGVDLVVNQGECVFLAGPSGSGKTTLLSIIGCILGADQGQVRVLGQDIQSLSTAARTEHRLQGLGFVFQKFHLIRGLTAIDNVCLPLVIRGAEKRATQARAMSLLEAVGLADKAHADPRNMSTGQCQRVAIARALAGDPELILADEPTASLDATNGNEVMELFRRLTTQEGKTAVVVSHDHRVFHFADRVCHLERGTISHEVSQEKNSIGNSAEAGVSHPEGRAPSVTRAS